MGVRAGHAGGDDRGVAPTGRAAFRVAGMPSLRENPGILAVFPHSLAAPFPVMRAPSIKSVGRVRSASTPLAVETTQGGDADIPLLPDPKNQAECHLYFAQGCHLNIALIPTGLKIDVLATAPASC